MKLVAYHPRDDACGYNYLDLPQNVCKNQQKIFSQIVVKIGDESHGFESVKKSPTKTNTNFPPLSPKKNRSFEDVFPLFPYKNGDFPSS